MRDRPKAARATPCRVAPVRAGGGGEEFNPYTVGLRPGLPPAHCSSLCRINTESMLLSSSVAALHRHMTGLGGGGEQLEEEEDEGWQKWAGEGGGEQRRRFSDKTLERTALVAGALYLISR